MRTVRVNYKGMTEKQVQRQAASELKLARRLFDDLTSLEAILRAREVLVPEDCALIVDVVNTKALINQQWSKYASKKV